MRRALHVGVRVASEKCISLHLLAGKYLERNYSKVLRLCSLPFVSGSGQKSERRELNPRLDLVVPRVRS
jgi:hypothetical protein